MGDSYVGRLYERDWHRLTISPRQSALANGKIATAKTATRRQRMNYCNVNTHTWQKALSVALSHHMIML